MNKRASKLLISLFVIFLIGINIAYAVLPTREFSESENRFLNQFPYTNINNILTGKFSAQFEKFVIDQVVFRDKWVAFKSDIERLLQKKENNGIYFGKDDYLLEKFSKPSDSLNKNIKCVNYFANKLPNIKTSVLLAPNSVKVYEDKLPKFAVNYDQLEVIKDVRDNLNSGIVFSDIYETLYDKKNEYIYYKTDHHWTMRGAYYAYTKLANDMGITPYNIEDFNTEIVSNSFFGTYYTKANNKHLPADSIELFAPNFQVAYDIEYKDSATKSNSLFDYSFLDKKDKYSFFLNGNHALLTIKTDSKNSEKIVVLKDSYAHSLLPFLVNHYQEVHVVDLRYYKLNIYDYINENEIDNALFLYSVATFTSDDNLAWLER